MKKLIIAMAAVLVSVSAFGQGAVTFNNRVVGVVDAKVTFVGTTTGVSGAGYEAQLFGGAKGTAEAGLAALNPKTTFRTGAGAGYVSPPATAVEIAGVTPGTDAALQMRVFLNGSLVGKSSVFNNATGGGTLPPANLTGLTAFTVVPEPSTIALGVIGAAALFLIRRRK